MEPWHRLGWDQIERVDWNAGRAEITFVHNVIGQAPNLVLLLADDLRFLDLARERITATTLLKVPLHRSGQPAGWLSARRRADGRGGVRWVLHSGDARWTPMEVTQAIEQARVQAGL